MTERERRAMLRGRPDVTCWESFLADVAARRGGVTQPAPVPVTVSGGLLAAPAAPARVPVPLPTPLVPAARAVPAPRRGGLSEAA
jgi:hypothetical protein